MSEIDDIKLRAVARRQRQHYARLMVAEGRGVTHGFSREANGAMDDLDRAIAIAEGLSEIPGPHEYLSCEDTQFVLERQRKALNVILERCDGTAWNLAAHALGLTYYESVKPPDSRDRFIVKLREDRDEARRDVLRLFDCISSLRHAFGMSDEWTDEAEAIWNDRHFDAYEDYR